MPGDEIVIFKGGLQQKTGILKLYSKIFPQADINSRWWEWFFLKNPEQKAIIYLARNRNNIIGHFAAIPVQLVYNRKIIKGAISFGAMVDPDFRGRGVFKELGYSLIKELKKQNYQLLFGLPNSVSYLAHKKNFGYEHIYTFYPWEISLSDFRKYKYKSKKQSPYRIERIKKLPQKFSLNISDLKIATNPSKRYLDWRFFRAPYAYSFYLIKRGSVIVGYAVFKFFGQDKKTHLIDLKLSDSLPRNDLKDIHELIFNEFYLFSRKYRVSICSLWTSQHFLINFLKEKGFKENFSRGFYFTVKPLNISHGDIFLKHKNWHIMMADTELF